jgi:hypothetical protein
MSIYRLTNIEHAQQRIGRYYERQIGSPAPMLSDTLSILTGPAMLPLLKELIREVEINDVINEMICCPDDNPCGSKLCEEGRKKIRIIRARG